MSRRRQIPRRIVPPSYRRFEDSAPNPQARRRENILYWCSLVCGLGALATIVTLAVTVTGGSGHNNQGKQAGARKGGLMITQTLVRSGTEEMYDNGSAGGTHTLASSPAIELLLFNSSSRHRLVEGARLTIEKYAHLDLCFNQGGGPLPEPTPYVIRMPTFPIAPENLIEAHLHDEIDPENADRMVLRFGETRGGGGYDLYKVRIQLRVFGSRKPLDAGRFVFSVPGQIPSYDGYLPEDNKYLTQFVTGDFRQARLAVTWCLRRNLASLLSVVTGVGARSPEMELLDHPVIASEWSRVRDYVPASAAARMLLENKQGELAVFAAEQTGDPGYEANVRKRAVAQLLGAAQAELSANAPSFSGERGVRVALEIEPSPRGMKILAQFKRRLAASARQ